jgi:hypothetical protein
MSGQGGNDFLGVVGNIGDFGAGDQPVTDERRRRE